MNKSAINLILQLILTQAPSPLNYLVRAFAAADRTDVQTPRDLITAANAKKQAGAAGGGVIHTCTKIDSRSAPGHSKLPAVEDGPHLGGDALRAIKEHLQADRQKVRQSLLAATPHMDMGKGWG